MTQPPPAAPSPEPPGAFDTPTRPHATVGDDPDRPALTPARVASLAVLCTLAVVLGVTFYKVVAPFLVPLFLAAVVAVLVRPWFMRLRRRLNRRTRLAAALITTAALLLVLLPAAGAGAAAVSQAVDLSATARRTVRDLEAADRRGDDYRRPLARTARRALSLPAPAGLIDPSAPAPDFAHLTGEDGEELPDVRREQLEEQYFGGDLVGRLVRTLPAEWADLKAALVAGGERLPAASAVPVGFGLAAGFLSSAVELVIALGMFAIGLYYFLCDGPQLLRAARELVPVRDDYQTQLLDRFDTVLRAVVLSTFLAALAQGVLTSLALQLCGFGHFFILAVVATLASLVPLLGAWLVWGPFAVWLFVHGDWISGTLLVAFGLGVIGTLDNVIRTVMLNTDAKLHPLLAFVCVLGGLKVMGLWGVFVGPVVASCLHTLLGIVNSELKSLPTIGGRGGPAADPAA